MCSLPPCGGGMGWGVPNARRLWLTPLPIPPPQGGREPLWRGRAVLTFVAKRLLQLIPTLFFVSVIIFSLQQLLPGDPAVTMAGEERDPAVIEQIRQQYRLDQPIPVQYVYWLKGVLTGDLGESMR